MAECKVQSVDSLTKDPDNGRAYRIEIFSFSSATKMPIDFPAFLKDFSDSYKSEWNAQRVLGKMDPIATFKGTTRVINLSFDIPNASITEAITNLGKIDYIIRGMYPIYDPGTYGTAVMSSPPYFRVRFSNLVRNSATNNDGPINTLRTGLMCYFNGFDFKPDTASGYFVQNGELYPKLISVTLSLNVIHEHPLGKKDENGNILNRDGFNNFPRLSGERQQPIPPSGSAPSANNGDVASTQGNEDTALSK